MWPKQNKDVRRARGNVQLLLNHRTAFTIGWCAAFVQWGRVHIVQHAIDQGGVLL